MSVIHPFQLQNKIRDFMYDTNERILVEQLAIFKVKHADITFNNFIKDLEKNNWQGIRHQFPVMEKILPMQKANIEKLYQNIINAYQLDKGFLHTKKIIQNYSSFIEDIIIGAGDFHQGESTAIIELNNGQKVVYKPTNGSILNSYFAFLDWVNENVALNGYRYNILNNTNYHWQEFVCQKECINEEDVSNYYKSAGKLLCILYLLNSVDYHSGNIIANGNTPVLIDHETVIQPKISNLFEDYIKLTNTDNQDTVLSSLILPHKDIEKFASMGICGLGCARETHSYSYTKVGINRFTINWTMTNKEVRTSLIKKNIPSISGENVFVDEYLEELISGFEECYNFFFCQKEFMLSSKSQIANFHNVPVRYLWRSTYVYSKILQYMSLPKNLKDEKLYEQKIRNYLVVAYKNVPKDSDLWLIYKHEVSQMLKGDIPYFEINTSSRDLPTEFGVIKGFFELSCIENLERKLNKLSVADLEYQKQLIVDSYAQ